MPQTKKKAGAVLATMALAAVAGSYYLYSKFDESQKRKVKSWVLRLKADVLDELENLREVTKDGYEKAVDVVSAKYAKHKNVDTHELQLLARDMKKHWGGIQKTLASRTKKAFK